MSTWVREKFNLKGNPYFSLALVTMYLDTLLMAIGFFMLIPLLGVHLINDLGWSAATAGSVMAVSGLSQHGFKFFAGVFADRVGYKKAILIGVGVRIIGFVLYGLVQNPIGFMAAAFVSGLGGSIFHPANYASYARLVEGEAKSRIFAIREMLSNMGFILGPVIGMFLLKLNFTFVCFAAAFMFGIAFVVTWVFLPALRGETEQLSIVELFSSALKDKLFLGYSLFIVFLWALLSQLYLAVPVRADSVLEDPAIVAYLYMVGAIFMVIVQLPLNRLMERYVVPSRALAAGSLVLGVGLLMLGFAQSLWGILAAILIFTVGQMVTLPLMSTLISRFCGPHLFATYFGLNGIALACGGFVGNSGSGYLYDFAKIHVGYEWLPWVTLFGFAILLSFLFFTVGKRFDRFEP